MTLYKNTLTGFNTNFFGFATLIIIGQSCLGSIAAMNILKNGTSLPQMMQLGIVVLICMLVNTSILAQMTHKTILNLTISSVFLSILLISLNLTVLS